MSADRPKTRRKARRRARSSWVILVMLGLVVGGVTAGMFLAPLPPPSELVSASGAASVPVVQQQFSDPIKVEALFVVSDATPLITRASGTVTTPIAGSGVLVSGKVALGVNGQPVIAVNTTVPLYRDLEIGDRGRDVEAFNSELTRLGYGELSSDRFTWSTVLAWRALLSEAGVEDPGWEQSLVDVIWLPERTVTLQSWSALPGTLVMPGDTIGYVRPKLLNVELSLANPVTPADGSRELRLFDQSLPLDDLEAPLSKEFLSALEQTPEFARMLLNERDTSTGTWSLLEPITALRVPPGALFAVVGSSACLQSGDLALPVTIVGAGLGATLVTTDQPVDLVAIGAGITATKC
ncbi:MAG: hypothetical protein LBE83_02650 [Propionibacteriaceae bacterium]|nr:hypothetical protein [Propionibacteriaceae bacterium]